MSGKGNIYTGININSKCARGNCAEQAAILEMLKHGESEIKKIVSYSVKGYIYSPCGKCRELIRMINSNNIKTKVMVAEDRYCTIGELLPEAFERREWENEVEKDFETKIQNLKEAILKEIQNENTEGNFTIEEGKKIT